MPQKHVRVPLLASVTTAAFPVRSEGGRQRVKSSRL